MIRKKFNERGIKSLTCKCLPFDSQAPEMITKQLPQYTPSRYWDNNEYDAEGYELISCKSKVKKHIKNQEVTISF